MMQSLQFCSQCNQGMALDIVGTIDDHPAIGAACPDCVAEYETWHFTCAHCETECHVEECSPDSEESEGFLCVGCSLNTELCERCDSRTYIGDLARTNDGNICPDCISEYSSCDQCGDYFRHYNCEYSTDHEMFCSSHCYNQQYDGYCGDCDTHIPRGESCGCHDREENAIASHSHKPRWDFIGAGPLYAGAEIEVESVRSVDNGDCAMETRENLGMYCATIKEDGSISSDRGFEIVTNPISWDNWSDVPLEDACTYLVKQGYRSHEREGCGLHVHVSRGNLTKKQLRRIAVFVHGQREHFERLGRRKSGRYFRYLDLRHNSREIAASDGDRYRAVNFCNSTTVEYRFPRGSLRPATILATVGLALAITEFCGTHDGNPYKIKETWQSFLKYLASEEKYSCVLEYAQERGCV